VGITSAKYSGSSSSGATIEGIGFAIPLNDVLPLLQDLMTNGRDTGPYLGISVKDMDAESADYFGLPMGAYVSEVVAGSCAEKGGLKPKDIITALGEQTVGSVNDLSRALRKFRAGDTVELTVSRGGQQVKLTVTLDEKPQQTQEEVAQQLPAQGDWSQLIPGFGG
jgi:serine protease Do